MTPAPAEPVAPELPHWLRLQCPECSADLTCAASGCTCERDHRFTMVAGIPHLFPRTLSGPSPDYVRWIHDYYRVPFSPRQLELSRQRFERFLEFAGPAMPILDVGCGRADRSAWFPGGQYVGVDPIDPVAARMVDRLPAPMVVARGERLPFGDAQFGSVMLWAVLDHIADRTPLIAECARVLRPGGKLCIMTQVIAETRSGISQILRWAVDRVRTGDLRGMLAIVRFTYVNPRVRAHLTPLTAATVRGEVAARFADVRSELLDGHSLILSAVR